MLCVFCQFVTVVIWQRCRASKVTAAAPCHKVPLWFLDGRTCWCSTCYRSRRVKARRPFAENERVRPPLPPSTTGNGCPGSQSPRAGRCSSYSGGGLRLCNFRSSRLFQYLKLLSKCCIRLGRSAKAGEMIKNSKVGIFIARFIATSKSL